MNAFELTGWFSLLLYLVAVVVEVWAFADAAFRKPQEYVAADKLTKTAWVLITGLALAATVLLGLGLLSSIGVIAALVYLVDVRPAIRSLYGRR